MAEMMMTMMMAAREMTVKLALRLYSENQRIRISVEIKG
jgi:hypothetical protein